MIERRINESPGREYHSNAGRYLVASMVHGGMREPAGALLSKLTVNRPSDLAAFDSPPVKSAAGNRGLPYRRCGLRRHVDRTGASGNGFSLKTEE